MEFYLFFNRRQKTFLNDSAVHKKRLSKENLFFKIPAVAISGSCPRFYEA